MDDEERFAHAATTIGEILEAIKRLSRPDEDAPQLQACIIEGLLKTAYTYALCCGMPSEVFMLLGAGAMVQVDNIATQVERDRAKAQPLTETQAAELLAHLKVGGPVH